MQKLSRSFIRLWSAFRCYKGVSAIFLVMVPRVLNNTQILKEMLPHVSDKVINEMLKYSSPEAINQDAFNEAVEQSIGYPGCLVAKAVVEYAHNSGNNDLYNCYVNVAEGNGFDIKITYNESRPKGWIVSIKQDGVEVSSQTRYMTPSKRKGYELTHRLTNYPSYIKAQKEIIHQTVYKLNHILHKVGK